MDRIKAVIFDWAGTTIDYGCFAPVSAFIEVFKRRGIDITIEEARAPMGLVKKDHIRALCRMDRISSAWEDQFGIRPTEKEVDELYQDFEPMLFDLLPNHVKLIPGVLTLVENLRVQGIKIGSTTGYTAEMMKVVSLAAKRQGYHPDLLVTSTDVVNGRPYPWMMYENVIRLGVFPMSAIVKVGDTLSDIEEGLNAGAWTVGVIKGSSELGLSEKEVVALDPVEWESRRERISDRMKAAGAHYVIDTLAELEDVIADINNRLHTRNSGLKIENLLSVNRMHPVQLGVPFFR